MADTPIEIIAPPGLTATAFLYPEGSDDVANGAGDTAVEATNRKGLYTATVSEALTGWHTLHLVSGSDTIGVWRVLMADDTAIKQARDEKLTVNANGRVNVNDGGYVDEAAWLDPTFGTNGGTGTQRDMVKTLTQAAAIGQKKVKFSCRRTFYLASSETLSFPGNGVSVLDLNGWSLSQPHNITLPTTVVSSQPGGSFTYGPSVTWTIPTDGYFENIRFSPSADAILAIGYGYFNYCRFGGNLTNPGEIRITTNATAVTLFYACLFGAINGAWKIRSAPASGAGTNMLLHGCRGDIELLDWTAGTIESYYSGGKLIVGPSNTGGTIRHTSHVEVVDENGDPYSGPMTLDLVSEPGGVSSFSGDAKTQMDTIEDGVAGSSSAGPGSRPLEWTILKPDSTPAIGAEAWISTDSAGATVVAGTFIADDSGIARVPGGTGLPMLDDDVVYYGWLDSAKVLFATNPIQFRYSTANSRWEIWNGTAYVEWT